MVMLIVEMVVEKKVLLILEQILQIIQMELLKEKNKKVN